jgi:hypothetical protein
MPMARATRSQRNVIEQATVTEVETRLTAPVSATMAKEGVAQAGFGEHEDCDAPTASFGCNLAAEQGQIMRDRIAAIFFEVR